MVDLPRLLVFDMDGVLADVSQSYRRAIIETAEYYLHGLLGATLPPGGLFSLEYVDLLKRAGGFNNDWDAAAGLIAIALSVLPEQRPLAPPSEPDAAGYARILRGALAACTISTPATPQMIQLCQLIAADGGGPMGLSAAINGRNGHLVFHSGLLDSADLVTRIFQEIYLGGAAFRQVYGLEPLFLDVEGLAAQEPIFVPPALLASLAGRVRLGIATGRPRQEAAFFLRRHGIAGYFSAVVTEDDVAEAEEQATRAGGVRPAYRKPHPWSLLRAMEELGDGVAAYLGDTPDDMRAAKAAGALRPVWAVGCLWGAHDADQARPAMGDAGADILLEEPSGLLRWLGVHRAE